MKETREIQALPADSSGVFIIGSSQNNAEQPDQSDTILAWFKKNRDSFLPVIGVVYFTGFLICSAIAYIYHLGFLPLLQTQYFVAGIIPSFLLWVGAKAAWWIYSAAMPRIGRFSDTARWAFLRRWWFRTFVGTLFVIFGLIPSLLRDRFKDDPDRLMVIFAVCTVLMCVFYGLATGAPKRSDKLDQASRFYIAAMPPLLFIAFAELNYFALLYPRIPQECGGMRPRHAYLDLKRAELSQEQRDALLPSDVSKLPSASVAPGGSLTTDSTPIVRSKPMWVFYDTSEYLLVKPDSRTGDLKAQDPTYLIRKDTTKGMVFFGEDLPSTPTKEMQGGAKSSVTSSP